jgi:signal transduction histidine kinase
MSSLGQLVAGLAHEINNSINAVYNGIPAMISRMERLEGLVQAAIDEGPAGEAKRRDIEVAFRRIRQLADVVEEGAERTARVIGDMKTFSHPGSESADEFDLNEALDLCVNLLDKHAWGQVSIHREYGPVGLVRGPYGQLNQVFLNLLSNAVQAMPDGGDIFLATRLDDAGLTVSVQDTGCGIPEDVRPRIFDPFFTTKPPGTGTGLGLTISYGIIARLGGTIECYSVEGMGTEFLVKLPASLVVGDQRGPGRETTLAAI